MKHINVISWGGGTQSTALMLMMLDQEKDIDYIIFADTGDESQMIYDQINRIIEYVKQTYDKDVIVTKKNKIKKTDDEILEMIQNGTINKNLSSTPYSDLYQEQKMFYSNLIQRATIVPFFVVDRKTGSVSKLPGRQCTIDYKIKQIQREIKLREFINRYDKRKHKLHMYIGFTADEIYRVKPSPNSFVENHYPLVERSITKHDCINYVNEKLGFKPVSSACNMCFALNFDQVYDIYANDKASWQRLIELDQAMESYNHSRIRGDIYMYHWQAKMRLRLKDIDMDHHMKERSKYKQLSIFDMFEEYQSMSCSGGCFI